MQKQGKSFLSPIGSSDPISDLLAGIGESSGGKVAVKISQITRTFGMEKLVQHLQGQTLGHPSSPKTPWVSSGNNCAGQLPSPPCRERVVCRLMWPCEFFYDWSRRFLNWAYQDS